MLNPIITNQIMINKLIKTKVGGEPILAASDTISFHFKTRKSSGLLYFNGKPPVSLFESI